MYTKIVVATVAAVAYFLWKLRSKTEEDDVVEKNRADHRSSINTARSTVSQLGHCDWRESLNTNTVSAEKESESTCLRSSQSNVSRRELEEYPHILKRSTRSSEQVGNLNDASCSSTAATKSDMTGLKSTSNLKSEINSKHDFRNSSNGHVDTVSITHNTNARGRYFSDVVKEPNQENGNRQIISPSTENAVKDNTAKPCKGKFL
ncbi:hypothetical protein DPMN_035301 [Dreissena polymorpha]|uniref:Uncharacterized protein n=1 Tax=Dreissena polymorpha TaxID=45954 RepID=A0A9D4M8Y7_DREPO|nr:hypothetical protein DPMN_035301 [Dreissena polymorpha]